MSRSQLTKSRARIYLGNAMVLTPAAR